MILSSAQLSVLMIIMCGMLSKLLKYVLKILVALKLNNINIIIKNNKKNAINIANIWLNIQIKNILYIKVQLMNLNVLNHVEKILVQVLTMFTHI